jgi:diadenosine tetraphosphate (Ap4A) HIT family hydrolase
MGNNCPFCDVESTDYRLVCESDYSFVIVNWEPLNDNHVLVLPKRHVTDFSELSGDESKDLLGLVSLMKKKYLDSYSEEPILHMNFGSHSTVPHIHFHLLSSSGGLREHFSACEGSSLRNRKSVEELVALRDAIRSKLSFD